MFSLFLTRIIYYSIYWKAGVINGAAELHVPTASGAAPAGMRGSSKDGGPDESDPEESINSTPKILIKADAGIGFQFFGLSGAVVDAADENMVNTEGGDVADQIAQQIGEMEGVEAVGVNEEAMPPAGGDQGMQENILQQMMQMMQHVRNQQNALNEHLLHQGGQQPNQ